MRTKIAAFAASVPLMLTTVGAIGGDLQFRTPTTDRAQQMQPLLTRAAHALQNQAAATAGGRISNLWLFPTGDDHTVFAQYTLTEQRTASKGAASQVRLELLQMQGDRVVEERDLTRVGDESTLSAHAQAEARSRS